VFQQLPKTNFDLRRPINLYSL